MSVNIPNMESMSIEEVERMLADCEMQRDICDSFVARAQHELKRRRKLARQEKREGLPIIDPVVRSKLH